MFFPIMKRFLQTISMTPKISHIKKIPIIPPVIEHSSLLPIIPYLARCITPSSPRGKTARYRAKLKAKLKRLRRNKQKQ